MNTIDAMNSTAEYTGTTMCMLNSTPLKFLNTNHVHINLALQISSDQDITSDSFLTASIISPGASADLISSSDNSTTSFPLAQGAPNNLSRLLDAFAKSYYSTLMWDLNFNRTTNAFANPSATQYLQNTINNAAGDDVIGNLSILGTSDLQGNPAQFSLQYICSVPRQKDTGSLIISVAVANIVLLSAFWKIFETIARRYLIAKDSTWNVCPGCLELGGYDCGATMQGSRRTRKMKMRRGVNNNIWQLDQDPLCQNSDVDQETLYSQSRSQPDLFFGKEKIKSVQSTRSVSTRDSQSSLRTVEEKNTRKGKIAAGEYLALS